MSFLRARRPGRPPGTQQKPRSRALFALGHGTGTGAQMGIRRRFQMGIRRPRPGPILPVILCGPGLVPHLLWPRWLTCKSEVYTPH